MDKCIKCGKIAAVPPFCLSCMLNMSNEDYRIQMIVYDLNQALETPLMCENCNNEIKIPLAKCPHCGHGGYG